MRDKQQITITHNPSRLERFTIGFEYDKTLQQVKRDMRLRVGLSR
jgi:small-conductance mechanosensitive channel